MLPAPPKVVVVARDPLARAGLALLVSADVVGQADDATAPEVVTRTGADVAVWDLGGDVQLAARAAISTVPVVALVPDGVAAEEVLSGSVRAVLPRPPDPAQLAAAITAAHAGLVALAPPLLDGLLRTPGRVRRAGAATSEPMDALTAREQEVLAGLAEGLSNKRIALRLGIREATVKFHVNAILAKLGADSRTDAVVRAARRGLVMI